MKSLSRDEKIYIKDRLLEKLTKLKASLTTTDTNALIKDDVLHNPTVINTIAYLKTILTEVEIEKGINIYKTFNTKGCFRVKLDEIILLEIYVDLSKEVLDKINRYDNLKNMINKAKYNDALGIEKYYILFTTWEAPNSERLNKINELVDLICKQIAI